eukprot:14989797-Alexandrium_andersonii.AAC.1
MLCQHSIRLEGRLFVDGLSLLTQCLSTLPQSPRFGDACAPSLVMHSYSAPPSGLCLSVHQLMCALAAGRNVISRPPDEGQELYQTCIGAALRRRRGCCRGQGDTWTDQCMVCRSRAWFRGRVRTLVVQQIDTHWLFWHWHCLAQESCVCVR